MSRLKMKIILFAVFSMLAFCANSSEADASFLSYIWPTKADGSFLDYIWPKKAEELPEKNVELEEFPRILYELDEKDEKFLKESSKLIGLKQSKLDNCQHRVVLKLKKKCHELNAEQIGKLAVMLLNCQSDIEGRKIFPCNDEMTLKECTSKMTTDAANAYLIMTNQAKAVCSIVRRDQFRGLSEMTVNKLMDLAQEQIVAMQNLSQSQKLIKDAQNEGLIDIKEGNNEIVLKQKDIMLLSDTQRAKIVTIFRELDREKSLIKNGQMEVANLLSGLKLRLDESVKQLEQQTQRTKLKHASLLNNMDSLQITATKISGKIDETSEHFSRNFQTASEQYEHTLKQLEKINSTIIHLAKLIDAIETNLDAKMNWVNEKLGDFSNKLSIILIHVVYLIFGMIFLTFTEADKFTKTVFISTVPLNFLANHYEMRYAMDMIGLSVVIGTVILANIIRKIDTKYAVNKLSFNLQCAPEENGQNNNTRTSDEPNTNMKDNESDEEISFITALRRKRLDLQSSGYSREGALTPASRRSMESSLSDSIRSATPFSLSMQDRNQCIAITQKGSQCKNAALPDADLCKIHKKRIYNDTTSTSTSTSL